MGRAQTVCNEPLYNCIYFQALGNICLGEDVIVFCLDHLFAWDTRYDSDSAPFPLKMTILMGF